MPSAVQAGRKRKGRPERCPHCGGLLTAGTTRVDSGLYAGVLEDGAEGHQIDHSREHHRPNRVLPPPGVRSRPRKDVGS